MPRVRAGQVRSPSPAIAARRCATYIAARRKRSVRLRPGFGGCLPRRRPENWPQGDVRQPQGRIWDRAGASLGSLAGRRMVGYPCVAFWLRYAKRRAAHSRAAYSRADHSTAQGRGCLNSPAQLGTVGLLDSGPRPTGDPFVHFGFSPADGGTADSDGSRECTGCHQCVYRRATDAATPLYFPPGNECLCDCAHE